MNTKIINRIKEDNILSLIRDNFSEEIYLVGGAVRDFALDKETFDRDLIVVNSDAADFANRLCKFFDATFVPLDIQNKIYRIVFPDKINYLDIINPIEGSLYKDLERRDLTINSIAVNINTLDIVDNFNGLSDIQNGLLNGISEHNFVDDPLRILRAYRFKSILGFKISDNLKNIILKHSNLLLKPAIERINYELLKLFSGEYAYDTLVEMYMDDILEQIFPVVSELKHVPPNTHHHLNLLYHSLETLKQIQLLYKNSDNLVKTHLEEIPFGGFSRLTFLKLAGFLHDVGKFSTWTIEEDIGRHRFIKHDDVGSKLVVPILKKMNFSNKQIDYVALMIKNHIYPSHVVSSPEVNDKIMMRFVRKMDDNAIDVIILAMADRLSARGPAITDDIVNDNITKLSSLLKFYLSVKDNLQPLPKLLTGNDVMSILNLKPSPRLGQIMNELHEAQLSGDVMSKEHAIQFIMQFK